MTSAVRRALLSITVVVAGVAAVVAAGGSASAAPGTLDPSFGPDGTVVTDVVDPAVSGNPDRSSAAADVVIAPDGKLVAAGRTQGADSYDVIVVARYLTDGSLDPSFGNAGIARTDASDPGAGVRWSEANAVGVQPDGKILAVGTARVAGDSATNFVVVRYLPDGTLDPDFGTGGIVRTQPSVPDPSNQSAFAQAALLEPNGRIVVGGEAVGAAGVGNITLVRYLPDGSLDPSFGAGGIVRSEASDTSIDPVERGSRAFALGAGPNDTIVAAGRAVGAGGRAVVALARYRSDGKLDASFGAGGIVRTDASEPSGRKRSSQASSMAFDATGRIVVAGFANAADDPNTYERVIAVARYNSDGGLDSGFGAGGIVRSDPADPAATTPESAATALVIRPDAKIVIGGYASAAGFGQTLYTVVRYLPDGSLDPDFAAAGVSQPLGASSGANSLALDPEQRLVAGGAQNGYFALARFVADGAAGPDTIAPDTVVSAPALNDAHEAGAPLLISGAAFDNRVVGAVQVAVKNVATGLWFRSDGWGGFQLHDAALTFPNAAFATTWSLPWTPAATGRYAVFVKTTDAAGNVDATKPWVPFSVVASSDDVAPEAELTTPAPGARYRAGHPLTISGSAGDNVAVERVQVAVKNVDTKLWYRSDGWGGFAYHDAALSAAGAAETLFALDWVPDAPGEYAVLVKTTDASGNLDPTKPWVRFSVADIDAPDAVVDAPVRDGAYTLGETQQISGSALDNISVGRVQIAVKDVDRGLWYRSDGWGSFALHDADLADPGAQQSAFSFEWTPETAGKHAVFVKTTDTAGNVDPTKPWVPFFVNG